MSNSLYNGLIIESIRTSNLFGFFKNWKILGFFSWSHLKIMGMWLALIFVVGISPLLLIKSPRTIDGYISISSQYIPVIIILLLSYVILFFGTIIYLVDVIIQTFQADRKIRYILPLYISSIFVNVICLFICYQGYNNIRVFKDIHNTVLDTEHFTKYIFYSLLLIDLLMLLAKVVEMHYYKATDEHHQFNKSRLEKNFISNQLFLIDIPVLLGVWFIAKFIERGSINGFYDTQILRDGKVNTFQYFKTYFAVGGIGMHIIFSQFIFLVLNTKMSFTEICEKVEKLQEEKNTKVK